MISEKNICLIGLLILRFAQSILFTWGRCNLYYFSYYKTVQPHITIDYNTLPIPIMACFGGILTIFSLQIAEKVGYLFHVRFLGILQCVCLLIAPYTDNYILFIASFYVLFGIFELLSAYPALTCLWSFYRGKEAIIQGAISAVAGVGIVILILLVTYLVNPDNKPAKIPIENGKNNFEYFDIDVSQNVPEALKKLSIVLAVMIFIGSFMIRKKSLKEQLLHQVMTEDISTIQPSPIMESFEIEKQNSKSILGEMRLKQAIFSKDFLLNQSINIVLLYFAISLSINYKVYSISKINNDYYVTFIDFLAQGISAIFNLFWGYLSHKLDYRALLIFVFVMSGITGMLLPIYGNDQIAFAVLYIGVNIFERAVAIITLPAYLKLYGNYLGKRLIPVTIVSSMMGAILAPTSNFFLINYFTYDQLFLASGILVLSMSLVPLALTRVPIS